MRLYDGKKMVELEMRKLVSLVLFVEPGYGPDISTDYFDAPYDKIMRAHIVDDVERCIARARDWENGTDEFTPHLEDYIRSDDVYPEMEAEYRMKVDFSGRKVFVKYIMGEKTTTISLIPLSEYAAAHNRSPVSVRQMAARGRFKTAKKLGRDWLIDSNEPYPEPLPRGPKQKEKE